MLGCGAVSCAQVLLPSPVLDVWAPKRQQSAAHKHLAAAWSPSRAASLAQDRDFKLSKPLPKNRIVIVGSSSASLG